MSDEPMTRDQLVSEVCRLRAYLRVIRDRSADAHLRGSPYTDLAICYQEAIEALYGPAETPEVRSARAPPGGGSG